MKRLILFCFLFCAFKANAQTNLNELRDLGIAYTDSMQYEKALVVFNQGLKIARSEKDQLAQAYFLIDIGVVYLEKNDLRKARYYFEGADSIGKKIHDVSITAYSNLNLGIIEKQKGNYSTAVTYLANAGKLYSEIRDSEFEASAYNTLGDIKSRQKKFTEALKDHRRALILRLALYEHADSTNRITAITDLASTLNNIGELYRDSGQYGLAEAYLLKSLRLKKMLDDTLFQASTLSAMASVYHAQHKTMFAKSIAFQAYEIRKRFADRIGIAASANQLALIFLDLKEYKTAERYIMEAIAVSQADDINDALLEAYNLARRLHREKGRLQLALYYDDLYISQDHVLFNIAAREIQEDAEARYELDKQEEEKEKMKKEASDSYRMLGGAIGFLAIIIITIAYAYFNTRKANKREALARKEAQRAKEQIESLWKELNHRVKNNLQILSGMMSLQAMQVADEQSKKALLDMENRVKAMGVMHRKLYLNNELTLIGIDVLITDLVTDLKVTFGIHNLELRASIEKIELPADKAIPLGLIVNEVLTNAFKYAFINHPDPHLSIELYKTQNKIRLSIKDNGPGFPEHGTKNNSFGFRLISLFSRQLNGTLEMDNDNGARLTLEIGT